MELTEAILNRRSIRAYLPQPVPGGVLEEIMKTAIWTPSFANTQPWEFAIVGGEKLEELRRKVTATATASPEGNPDIPWPNLIDPWAQRRRQGGIKTVQAKNIARDDQAKREWWRLFGAGCFDAPHVIVIYIDRCFTAWGVYDVGAIAFSIMLLAHSHGLGTCPQAAPTRYPQVFHEVLDIPESKLVILALPIGYPNWSDPVNQIQREREPLENLAHWHGIAEA